VYRSPELPSCSLCGGTSIPSRNGRNSRKCHGSVVSYDGKSFESRECPQTTTIESSQACTRNPAASANNGRQADNIARTHQELVANCGDELVVFGWIPHRTEAVAYNTRIQRAGRIPADRLNTFTSSPFMGGNLCIAKERQTSRSIDCIAWSAGDCIFVWDRIEGKHCIANGFGFNRATGAIGRFETTSFNLPALP
jgi:hypothetical protein